MSEYGGHRPRIHASVFLAPNAVVLGNVRIEAEASVWFGAVIRGDDPDHPIVIGPGTSIQDNCIVHVGNWGPTVVGAGVTVGHGAAFESCTIGDGCVIGMNAVILQNASVGRESVVGAGAVVTEGAEFPERSVIAGVPARLRKSLDGRAAEWIARGGQHYVELGRAYRMAGLHRLKPGSLDAHRDEEE
ncbi:MAG: gamma carbonic anhydrase family protein [Gemmatimonadetes bacterium]|nr:gamma carbonic anhydrase family protein [Gemmatimonadota bacterium]MBT8478421.1 gamma carbonic anhydrase family protein [Gemmatimonadota bacterium]NNF38850.1 gamma carbonic anhydrase family protein [Gemmatimonadota bacterium]NNK62359.1 gamma carbonic anhydrase family protein [Gemmatimonadota bacterium]